MRQKINEEVSVVLYFSSKKRMAAPLKIIWKNKEYTLKEMGYKHAVMEGQTLHHIYELTVNEEDLWLRLNLDTSNLHWNLEAVSDGLAD